MLRSFSWPAKLARGINKDPTVWVDGARPHPDYIFKNNIIVDLRLVVRSDMSLMRKTDVSL